MNKEIAIVGLGKMGMGVAQNLNDKGWRVIVYNRSKEKVEEAAGLGMIPAYTYKEMVEKFTDKPRVIWLMLPAGEVTEAAIFGDDGIATYLEKNDIVIDAANSFYKDDQTRFEKLSELGIDYIDVGVSGGPSGARKGACLMIGGSKMLFKKLEELYKDMSVVDGYAHFEGVGAGHFVKMVHNGIEYGMMQAIGEGFNVMKKSPFNLDLVEVARVYNQKSVIESRLIDWLKKAYEENGLNLESISGSINHSGEGKWTIETASEMSEIVPVIKESYDFRVKSQSNPSYTGKVVSALRGQFGGHLVKKSS